MKKITIEFHETSNYDEVIRTLDLVRETLLLQKQVDSQRLVLAHSKRYLNDKCLAFQEPHIQNTKKCNELHFDFRHHNSGCQNEQTPQTEKADSEKWLEPILLTWETDDCTPGIL